jgi:hypothetical protein
MKKHNNYWTKEKCFDIVKNCETKKEFKKNGEAYSSSLRNGWMVFVHIWLNQNLKTQKKYYKRQLMGSN